jgi:glycerol-3-phosphate dehydrogenase (NAD+)
MVWRACLQTATHAVMAGRQSFGLLGSGTRGGLAWLQGCAEIRWLADKMGAKPETVSGLSGLGDIMLTCYGALSRNRAVGMRLGQGEALDEILASSSQVGAGDV